MTRRPRAYVAALPLSALPDIQELLRPFFGGEGRREHVVMVRVGEEGVGRLDELVEAGLFGSRSEAAAFLIGAGIQAQSELFARIGRQAAEIKRLRGELRKEALATLRGAARSGSGALPAAGRGTSPPLPPARRAKARGRRGAGKKRKSPAKPSSGEARHER